MIATAINNSEDSEFWLYLKEPQYLKVWKFIVGPFKILINSTLLLTPNPHLCSIHAYFVRCGVFFLISHFSLVV